MNQEEKLIFMTYPYDNDYKYNHYWDYRNHIMEINDFFKCRYPELYKGVKPFNFHVLTAEEMEQYNFEFKMHCYNSRKKTKEIAKKILDKHKNNSYDNPNIDKLRKILNDILEQNIENNVSEPLFEKELGALEDILKKQNKFPEIFDEMDSSFDDRNKSDFDENNSKFPCYNDDIDENDINIDDQLTKDIEDIIESISYNYIAKDLLGIYLSQTTTIILCFENIKKYATKYSGLKFEELIELVFVHEYTHFLHDQVIKQRYVKSENIITIIERLAVYETIAQYVEIDYTIYKRNMNLVKFANGYRNNKLFPGYGYTGAFIISDMEKLICSNKRTLIYQVINLSIYNWKNSFNFIKNNKILEKCHGNFTPYYWQTFYRFWK